VTDSPSSAASSAPSAAGGLPGVVADCTSPPPYRLSAQPTSITLACADDGLGVENMSWTGWASSAATGRGTFWEKLCVPSCATGKIGTYPVAVTLSAGKTSSQGSWFSLLTVAWVGTRPPASTPDSYTLMAPTS
jgi:hypothetical protein